MRWDGRLKRNGYGLEAEAIASNGIGVYWENPEEDAVQAGILLVPSGSNGLAGNWR